MYAWCKQAARLQDMINPSIRFLYAMRVTVINQSNMHQVLITINRTDHIQSIKFDLGFWTSWKRVKIYQCGFNFKTDQAIQFQIFDFNQVINLVYDFNFKILRFQSNKQYNFNLKHSISFYQFNQLIRFKYEFSNPSKTIYVWSYSISITFK